MKVQTISFYPRVFIKAEDEKGFSMIEILIALSVFAVGLLAISSLQIGSINNNGKARRSLKAVAIAQDQVETLMTTAYAAVNTSGPVTVNNRYNVAWIVDPPIENTKDVALVVSWPERGKTRSITMNFIVRDESI